MSENKQEMPPLPPPPDHTGGEKEKSAPKKNGIEVKALQPGFFKQHRKAMGDVFLIQTFEQLGSWMECTDPVMQKKHLAAMAERKVKLRKLASEQK